VVGGGSHAVGTCWVDERRRGHRPCGDVGMVGVVGYTAMEVMRVRCGGRGDGKGRKPFLHCANDWPHSIKR